MDSHDERIARRRLIGTGLGAAAAVAGGLVVRNQIRHPPKRKRPLADIRPRRLLLAAPDPSGDPVLLTAVDQGMFERYRLDIRLAAGIGSSRDALDQVQSGHADAAVAAALGWLPRLQTGLDARLVCGLQAGSARLLVARRSPLRRIEDLHRRVIGIADPDGPDRLFFSIMMRRKGMDPNHDVEWRSLPTPFLGLALAEGQVQAIVGHDPSIWKLRQTLHLGELASSMSGSYGARVSRVLGMRTAVLRDDPQGAVALTLAMQEAATWVAAHPRQVGALLAAHNVDLTLEQANQMLKSEGHDVHPVGHDLRNQIAQYVDELQLLGLATQNVDSTAFAKRVTADVLKG